jgi:hypothetical protein
MSTTMQLIMTINSKRMQLAVTALGWSSNADPNSRVASNITPEMAKKAQYTPLTLQPVMNNGVTRKNAPMRMNRMNARNWRSARLCWVISSWD